MMGSYFGKWLLFFKKIQKDKFCLCEMINYYHQGVNQAQNEV